jgi:1,4-alpha-glucan branching enzyme
MLKKKYFKTMDECEVTFEYDANGAEQVALVIEANDWQPVEMTKRAKDNVFAAKMRLPKNGRYQFRYLLDGHNWVNDNAADAYTPNEFGEQNSVVFTSN